MSGLYGVLGTAGGLAVLWYVGLRALRKTGGLKEKLCYTGLLVWSACIVLSKQLNWFPLTTSALNAALFKPFGKWIDWLVKGSTG
jgi:hypothetical protein